MALTWIATPQIERLLGEFTTSVINKPRESKFRVSVLPYCPIYNLFEDFHSTEEYPYNMGFYTNIGHAVHNLMQEFIPHYQGSKIKVFGNWECSKCHTKHQHKFHTDAKKLYGKCSVAKEKCWPHVQYKELELLWKNLSGHTDMLWVIEGKWYLIDFKTTSSALWRTPAATLKSRKFPPDKYGEQIETYAALLYAIYKIKISYCVIMYVARDAPQINKKIALRGFMRPFTKKIYQQRMRRLKHFNRQYQLYQQYRTAPTKDLRQKLIDTRPCHTAKDYNKKMQLRFEYKPCPNWSNFVCRTDSGVNQFLKDVALLGKNK